MAKPYCDEKLTDYLQDAFPSMPSYGFCSGGFDFPANTECEFLSAPYERPGYTTHAFTKNWQSFFNWPAGSGGKITIMKQAVYKVHFQAVLFNSPSAWVICRLKLLRGSSEFELLNTYTRLDGETGMGNVELLYESEMMEKDRIRITLEGDRDIHGAPNGECSQLHIQLIGFLP